MQIFIGITLILVTFLLLSVIAGFVFFAIDLFLMELPYVSTKKEKISTIIKLANIKRGETVVDLGAGDGRLLFPSAKKGAHSIGYELNPYLVLLTRIRWFALCHSGLPARFAMRSIAGGSGIFIHAFDSGVTSFPRMTNGSVRVLRRNLWSADLKVANVIFVYGRKKTMQKFQNFVYKNAKKGTRLVVNDNPFPTKKPIKVENKVYLYKV